MQVIKLCDKLVLEAAKSMYIDLKLILKNTQYSTDVNSCQVDIFPAMLNMFFISCDPKLLVPMIFSWGAVGINPFL